jgi:ribosome-binding ATPase YchF (GTP1/OBG family)
MFGKDTETIKMMNEMISSWNDMQKKMTIIWGISQKIENKLSETNEILKDIHNELIENRKIAISPKLTSELYDKNIKDKRLHASEPCVYLDEIIEAKLSSIKEDLQNISSAVEIFKQ